MKANAKHTIKIWAICCAIALHVQFTFGQYTSKLLPLDTGKYLLRVTQYQSTGDSITFLKRLPYQVFKFIQADINNDGRDEFIVGAIKKTILDTVLRKRINIWKIDNNSIVPLWLGSKMPRPLYDFEVKKLQNKFKVITIEHESNGLFLLAEYEWHSFGLKFIRYIKREITIDEAILILHTP